MYTKYINHGNLKIERKAIAEKSIKGLRDRAHKIIILNAMCY